MEMVECSPCPTTIYELRKLRIEIEIIAEKKTKTKSINKNVGRAAKTHNVYTGGDFTLKAMLSN